MHDYELHTRGGRFGYVLRRVIHVLMILVPIAYHYWGDALFHYVHRPKFELLLIVLVLIVAAELWRLKKNFLVIGQRMHESTHISSFAWGAIAMVFVLLLVPNTIYAIPIVAGCAIGDPLIGILKNHLPWYIVRFIAFVVIGLMWWVCCYFMLLPIWFPWIISAITVLVEWPNVAWIDDNALMQLVPLLVLLLVLKFYGYLL